MEADTQASRRRTYDNSNKKELREYFNLIYGRNDKSIDRIAKFYSNRDGIPYNRYDAYDTIKKDIINYTIQQNIERTRRADERIARRGYFTDEIINVKFDRNLNGNLNVRIFNLPRRVLFTRDNLEMMNDILDEIKEEIPNGFNFGVSIRGFRFERNDDGEIVRVGEESSIFKSYLTDNMNSVKEQLQNSGRLDAPSEIYYETSTFQVFYESDQGGTFKKISYDDLEMYDIYSPSSKNCGRECLKHYKVEADKGILSIAMMKALSPVPVLKFEKGEKRDEFNKLSKSLPEFILLRENHFVRCILKTENKKQKLLKRMEITEEKVENHIKKLELKKVSVFDFESGRVNKKQTPLFVGLYDGKTYSYKIGEKCLEEFVSSMDCEYYIGYNSGNYDYILLRPELIRQGWLIKENNRSCNSVIRAEITKEGRIIQFIDLINFTNGSLAYNLHAFGCTTQKGELDYSKIKPDMTDEFKNELIEYCRLDVVGTYELFRKLEEPYNEKGMSILELFTASQGAYKILKRSWKKNGYLQHTVSRNDDNFFRKAVKGGRCEVYKREFKSSQYEKIKRGLKYDEVKDFMRALDVNSLYPSAMAKNAYPIGEHKHTTKYVENKLGIYKVQVVKPKTLNIPVNSDNLIDGEEYLTSVAIERGKRYGYKYKINYGFYWDECEYIMRDVIEELYEIRQKTEGSSPQNKNAKLMMNSMYGKTIQRDEKITHFVINSNDDLIEMYKGRKISQFKGEWINGIGYYEYHEVLPFMTDKKSYIGAFILDYSKEIMTDLLQVSEPFYTDTDSIYIDNKFSSKFDIGRELGQFSDDVKGKIIYACFVAKKLKYIEYINEDNEIKVEITGKGCNVKDLTKNDFRKMLKGLTIENKNEKKFKRNLFEGQVEIITEIKNIKMNEGNRIFNGNDSVPRIK
jgi:hypothetical protein